MGDGQGGFASDPTAALPLPRVFGRLLLVKLVARGGMGDVYLAATTGIEGAERPCIVKTVRRDHIHDGSFLARFLDEARVQAQLNHPGVAQVLEASTDDNGEPFTVVEYVEGRSLADVRQRAVQLGTKIEWPDAVCVAIEIAQALAHVHERPGPDGTPLGIVHRDLSPQNVMLGYAGDVKLIDFGTARGHNRRCHTVAGVVFAKPGYVAPEVARQQIGDGRIDVYALGVMLWEMAKGCRFFTGDPQKHLEDAAAGKVVLPRIAKAVGAPELLDEVIQKLTANDPDDRYASAARAVPDLAKLLATAPAGKGGERGLRARIALVMRTLWPHEPGKSRAEFARLLKEARPALKEASISTPTSTKVAEVAAQMRASDPAILPGTPYRLGRMIGEGASGTVYEAEHVELGRKLALKVLTPSHTQATDAIERFRREARALAKLSHPNLVALYDFGKSLDGKVFLAMELLVGDTLDKRVQAEGALDWKQAVGLAIDVTKALSAAHDAGLVHRDLKPQNLFLTSGGTVKLLDFGVAMALSDTAGEVASERKQRGFAVFGTPEYMAPEQVAGEVVDARCDIYALGCVLYELLTGVRVFEGTSSVVVMGKQLRELVDPPRSRAPQMRIPEAVEEIVMRALSKRRELRYATAQEMRDALLATVATEEKPRSRTRRVAGIVVGAAALLAAFGLTARFVATKDAEVAFADDALAASSAVAPAMGDGDKTDEMPPEPAMAAKTAETVAAAPSPAASAPSPGPSFARDLAEGRGMTKLERVRALADARNRARAHLSDPALLKAWAWAAYRAGDLREAKRAAQMWGLHDASVGPKLLYATALEASGHRNLAKSMLEQWVAQHPADAEEAKELLARLAVPAGKGRLARK